MNYEKYQDCGIDLILLEDKDISTVLSNWEKINKQMHLLAELEESLKTKIKVYMKEERLDKFVDANTNISVAISTVTREDIDVEKLKAMITPNQFLYIHKMTSYQKMTIMTEDMRKKIRKFVKF